MTTEHTPDETDETPAPLVDHILPEVQQPAEPELKTKAKLAAKPSTGLPASEPGQTATAEGVDEVHLFRCVYKAKQKRSLSVHHLQRRLAECGYRVALRDRDGWLADNTVAALKEFQGANKLKPTGVADKATLELLFDNDPNVKLVL